MPLLVSTTSQPSSRCAGSLLSCKARPFPHMHLVQQNGQRSTVTEEPLPSLGFHLFASHLSPGLRELPGVYRHTLQLQAGSLLQS